VVLLNDRGGPRTLCLHDIVPMAGFGLPNFGQLTEAFRKAQQIQQDAQKLQDGRASVWLSGNQQPLRVRLAPELVACGAEATEAAALEALRAAYEKSTATMKERMEELTGGLNLTGMGG
jgi:nucleoid-associated protein EbfC